MNRLSRLPMGKLQSELSIQSHLGRGCFLLTDYHHCKEAMKAKVLTKCEISNNYNDPLRLSPRNSPDLFVRRYITSIDNRTCWNCQNMLKRTSLFCESCNSLQPVDKQADFFNIMGMKSTYSLDQSELKQKFRSLQTRLHPDKFSSRPKKEQELSEEFSSTVNKAYSTLLDPLERGLYMLSLNSISIEEGTTSLDRHFLMEIMERNEEIENESNPQNLNEFYRVNRKQLDLLIGKITQAFESNDLKLAKKLLTEMKYYNTIENKIKETKQKLNIPD